MNLVYGKVVDVVTEEGMRIGRVRVSGALKKIPLELLEDVRPGDRVLICDGCAISKVIPPTPTTEMESFRLRHLDSKAAKVQAATAAQEVIGGTDPHRPIYFVI